MMKGLVITVILTALTSWSMASVPIIARITREISGVQEIYSGSNMMGFRILHRGENSLLIGGRNMLLVVNHENAANPELVFEEFQTCDNGNVFFQCKDKVAFQTDRDCFNFIRVAENVTTNLMLVCGTNALNPRCYICNVTRTNTMSIQDISCPGPREAGCTYSDNDGQGTLDGADLVPLHWELNATAIFTGGKLYVGVSKSQVKSQSVISGVDVNLAGPNGSETSFTNRLENFALSSRSVNDADFVGKPVIRGDRAYFFYREIAVEHISQGRILYSRVARVCKDDAGLNGHWSSFQKARLNCSIPGAFPSYLNEIQDIFEEERGGEVYIHAIFTGLPNGPTGSAVCIYKLSDIDSIFDTGRFRGPQSQQSIWLPRPSSEVPNPRPGQDCNNRSSDTFFLPRFPLMQQLVPNTNQYEDIPRQSDAPIFRIDNIRFSAVVMDTTPSGDIYYIATESGTILKAYNSDSGFKVYEIAVTESKQPLIGLQLTGGGSSNRYLIAVSNNMVYNVPLQDCATRCREQCSQFLYGYCQWQEQDSCCRKIGETTCSSSPSDVYVSLVKEGIVPTCENKKLDFYCQVQTSPLCAPVDIKWTQNGMPVDNLGHLVTLDQLDNHPHQKLSHLSVKSIITRDRTTIGCSGRMVETSFTQTVNKTAEIQVKNCVTKASLHARYIHHQEVEAINRASKDCNVDLFSCNQCRWND